MQFFWNCKGMLFQVKFVPGNNSLEYNVGNPILGVLFYFLKCLANVCNTPGTWL